MITAEYGIDLYWLPLGAGGWFVRMNGLIYEAIMARREHRLPFDLYHTALEVRVPEGRFVIENAWPIPNRDGDARGVLVVGPVGSPSLGRLRMFRYEIRRWRDGRNPRHRVRRREPSVRERRRGPGPPAARPSLERAGAAVGEGRARDPRHVELELHHLVATRLERAAGGGDPTT